MNLNDPNLFILLSDIAQGLNFIQSRSGDPHPSYGGYSDPTSLLPVSVRSTDAMRLRD